MRVFKKAAVVAAGLGLAATGIGAAQAATTVTIRPTDLIAPSDTAGGASYTFLRDGVAIQVPNDDPGTYARAHFKVGVPLSSVTQVAYDWVGTQNKPGIYFDIDLDGDGNVDGQFIGDLAYGNDLSLNRDAEDFPASKLADGTFAAAAPCTGNTAATGVTDPCGSAGNPSAHGLVRNWVSQLQTKTGKTPVVYSGGFVGNGLVQGGVLRSITYGPNQYVFSSDAAPKTTPTITIEANKDQAKAGRQVKINGTVKGAGAGATVDIQRKKNGEWRTKGTVTLPATGVYSLKVKVGNKLGVQRFRAVAAATTTTNAVTSKVVKVKVVRTK